MLREKTLFEDRDKVKESIQFLQDHEPPEGYYLAFSGGKDSVCIKELADMAGVKYDAHFNNTTIETPELIAFIRKYHSDVKWNHPAKPLLRLMETKGFPMRQRRWCCELYKERGGSGRRVITGIRAAESAKRAGRRAIETCYKDTSKIYINPIITWSNDEVWEFIKGESIPYCKLYDEGFKRIGCLFCPLANAKARDREFKRYPRLDREFEKTFVKIYEHKKSQGRASIERWRDGREMYAWWKDTNFESEDPDQGVLFE